MRASRPSRLFALSGGAFLAGIVLIPISALAWSSFGGMDPAVWVTFLAIVLFVLGTATTRVVISGEQLDADLPNLSPSLLLGVPLGVLLTTLLVRSLELGLAAAPLTRGIAGTALALLGGGGLDYAAKSRRIERLLAESETRIELPGPVSGETQRLLWWIAVVTYLFLGAYTLVRLSLGWGFDWDILVIIGGGSSTLYLASRHSRILVDDGLVSDVSLRAWDDFDAFEITTDEIVLRYSSLWRGEVRIPRDELAAEDAVVELLSENLPER